MPIVSVIIPLHNKEQYVAETLESLKRQFLTDWETIVVENGSTDDGPKVVAEMASKDRRIQLIKAPTEVCGPCGARNLGIEQARGAWLLFLDADDRIEPEHLQCLVMEAEATGADVVAGGWKEFIEGSDSKSVARDGPTKGATSMSVLEASMAFAPWAVHAAIVRRNYLGFERRWPMEMERFPSEDSVFWFRLLHGAKLATVSGHSAIYRKETPGNRDAYGDLVLWTEAILRVIDMNETYLRETGKVPSPEQAGNVMRSLESLWIRCRKARAGQEVQRVECIAKRWLRMCGNNPGFVMRRVLGFRTFNALMKR